MSLFKKKEKTDVPASASKPTEGHNPYLNARQEWLERWFDNNTPFLVQHGAGAFFQIVRAE